MVKKKSKVDRKTNPLPATLNREVHDKHYERCCSSKLILTQNWLPAEKYQYTFDSVVTSMV